MNAFRFRMLCCAGAPNAVARRMHYSLRLAFFLCVAAALAFIAAAPAHAQAPLSFSQQVQARVHALVNALRIEHGR